MGKVFKPTLLPKIYHKSLDLMNEIFFDKKKIKWTLNEKFLYHSMQMKNNLFSADLVAYSSTVIPLKSYEVSYNIGGKINDEEYKEAYLKHMHKKVKHHDESPDTLITC